MLALKVKDFMHKFHQLINRSEEYQTKIMQIDRSMKELMWRNVFVDTAKGYDWYQGKPLSLGRWAIGYNYAYVLARVLNDFKPLSILECGLGQSSKIISDYVVSSRETKYDIVEQDRQWADFFFHDNATCDRIQVHFSDIVEKHLDDKNTTYVYEEFDRIVGGKKYDLMSIDGPKGGGGYSRVDVAEHIPSILKDDFVIMVDDYNRDGEKNMVRLIEQKLQKSNIPYFTGIYSGEKDICIIVSSKWNFLTSL